MNNAWRGNSWTVAPIWNASLENREKRETTPRDYLWASELSKSPVDVFLRQRGIEETNPPNGRSMRKFEAGNYMEWLVSLMFKRAGILKKQQERVEFQYPGLMRVSGRMDFMVGGIPDYSDWERTEELLKELDAPEFIFRAGKQIREEFATQYPEGLAERIIEAKSCSGMMFEAMEKKGWKGQKGHRLQLFLYLIGSIHPKGKLLYVEKDSLRLAEVDIENPSDVEKEFKDKIEMFTMFYENHGQTPLNEFIEPIEQEGKELFIYHHQEGLPTREPLLVFSDDLGKFDKNFNIEYSGYLTALYGFQNPAEYADAFRPIVSRWNRVLTRVKKGDKMTVKNLEVIDEIKENGFDFDRIAESFVVTEAEEED
jgi:hypothetical protein